MLKDFPIVPYIPASNVARARRFYEERVGLVPREEVAGGVVYECAARSWIFLYPPAGAGTSRASQAFWQVENIEAEVSELKKRGVMFENDQRHRDRGRQQGRVVQGHRREHHGDHSDRDRAFLNGSPRGSSAHGRSPGAVPPFDRACRRRPT